MHTVRARVEVRGLTRPMNRAVLIIMWEHCVQGLFVCLFLYINTIKTFFTLKRTLELSIRQKVAYFAKTCGILACGILRDLIWFYEWLQKWFILVLVLEPLFSHLLYFLFSVMWVHLWKMCITQENWHDLSWLKLTTYLLLTNVN